MKIARSTSLTCARLGKLLGSITALMLLGACAVAPIASNQTLTGKEGAVILKLVTNGTDESDPAEALSALLLERVLPPGEKPTGRDTATLVRTRQATYSTAVFSGMVDPGRYVVKHATGMRGNMTYTFPIDAKFGSFEVLKGEVTLLGTLLVQPRIGYRFVVAYVAPEKELQETFESLYPALAAQTKAQAQHGFDQTPELARRAEFAAESKRRAALWNSISQPTDGQFLAGTKLGKVLWRKDTRARWRELDTGSWREVMSAAPFRGGIVAAGEEGLLRLSTDEGRNWKPLTPPDRALLQLVQPFSDGSLVIFARKDRTWSVYRSQDVDSGTWTKLGEFADSASINIPWVRPMAVAWKDNAGVMLANGDFYVTDGSSVLRAGTGQSTLSVAVMPDGSLIAQTVAISRSTLRSTDFGKTWVDLHTSRFVIAATFKDKLTGYTVGPVAPGVFAGVMGLMTTRDGGDSWLQTGRPPGLTGPNAIRQLAIDRSDASLLAFLPDNMIVRSVDEGKTWTTVKDD